MSLILSYPISHFQCHFCWVKQNIFFKDGLINMKSKLQCKHYNPFLGSLKQVDSVFEHTAEQQIAATCSPYTEGGGYAQFS